MVAWERHVITHHSPRRTVDYSFRARVAEVRAGGVPAAGTAVHTRPGSASARAAMRRAA